ncbi:hypothetical protein [Aquimarina pacifica]|uniref:hypothetical protein n=1 Tax=Aquimarina pacifica TaxID=1296415 RepID=UPI0004723A64|nr:hypothetical protein [Aquimarina pacifica]
MNNYKLTIVGLVLSSFLYFTSVFLELEVFEQLINFLIRLKHHGFDSVLIPLLVFFGFVYIDHRRRHKESLIEKTKLKIYKAMLTSSHHILNNFIYQMDIFKVTAEDTPGFDTQILAFYEDIIDNTSDQIYSLSNITTIDEFSIRTSVMH